MPKHSNQPVWTPPETARAEPIRKKPTRSEPTIPPPTGEDQATVQRLFSYRKLGYELLQINPGIAQLLLARNQDNRSMTSSRVEVYARDIAAGAWEVNNQGIALGQDGTLLDGQHRLAAVIRARCPVMMLVAYGLPPTVRYTIDQGRARSLADTLRIVDGNPESARIVSWFKAIEHLVSGRPKPLSHAIVRRQQAIYDQSVRWFLEHGPRGRPHYRAPVVGALLYAHHVMPNEVEHFTRRFVLGANLSEKSPVLNLRDYIVSNSEASRIIALKTLRALLADIRNEQVERLYAIEESLQYFRDLHDASPRASDGSEDAELSPSSALMRSVD